MSLVVHVLKNIFYRHIWSYFYTHSPPCSTDRSLCPAKWVIIWWYWLGCICHMMCMWINLHLHDSAVVEDLYLSAELLCAE